MSEEVNFVDILEPRRTESDTFRYMTRRWDLVKTMALDKIYSPEDLKDFVAKSVYLDNFIDAESTRTGVSKTELHKEVLNYLEEMGLDKKLHVIRWMGVFFLKISFMMKIKLFVNEPKVLQLKLTMGRNPVLFLPTHRSYADFCLMTYLCCHYDIDFPAVAAGMDFYSMAIVGRRMRETGAFYIRRTLVGSPLYAATLREYVRTVVAKYSSPIEFFLEGTRSRSNKSLPPKYGMLSMSLMPYFAREVSDITIVPVNISYDRLMEQGLFAYEHLGVPKPKESTGGLLKSLRSLNDHFGNIYINLGSPLSLRGYLQDESRATEEIMKPNDLQQITPEQFRQVQDVAEHVISLQQQSTAVTITNLVAIVLMQSLVRDEPLSLDGVVDEVVWVVGVLGKLGASVFENDVKGSVDRILVVHNKLLRVDSKRKLRLLSETLMNMSSEVKKKIKGHTLEADTMALAIPVIQLQLYVNPVMHYLFPPALVYLIASRGVDRDMLVTDYNRLRKLFRNEYFYVEKNEEKILKEAIEYCTANGILIFNGDKYSCGSDEKLQRLLKWSAWPALTVAIKCAEIMTEQTTCTQKVALKLIQQRVESQRCHPYCLSLEAAAGCLRGLLTVGALHRQKDADETYTVVPDKMNEYHGLLSLVTPSFNVDWSRNNTVILDHRTSSRL